MTDQEQLDDAHYRKPPSVFEAKFAGKHDAVNHPRHYTSHPSGVECIQVTEHMSFCLGNAVKYIWRAGEKDNTSKSEDLEKAVWYLKREIKRLTQ